MARLGIHEEESILWYETAQKKVSYFCACHPRQGAELGLITGAVSLRSKFLTLLVLPLRVSPPVKEQRNSREAISKQTDLNSEIRQASDLPGASRPSSDLETEGDGQGAMIWRKQSLWCCLKCEKATHFLKWMWVSPRFQHLSVSPEHPPLLVLWGLRNAQCHGREPLC